MSVINAAWGAGETKTFQEQARFFRLVTTVTPVDVVFYTAEGKELERAEGVEAGYSETFALPFGRVTIASAAAQTVKAFTRMASKVGYDRSAGSVVVTNLPAAQGAYVNSRATVTAAGVSTLLPASSTRRYVLVQNNDPVIALRLTMDGVDPTIAQGIKIAPGGYWESPAGYAPTAAIKAIAESGAGIAVEVVGG